MNLNKLFHKGFFDNDIEDDKFYEIYCPFRYIAGHMEEYVIVDSYTQALRYKVNKSPNEYCYVPSDKTVDIMQEKTAFQIYVALFMDYFEIEKESKEWPGATAQLFKETLKIIQCRAILLPPNLLIKILEVSRQYEELDVLFTKDIYLALQNSRAPKEIQYSSAGAVCQRKKSPIEIDYIADTLQKYLFEQMHFRHHDE